MLSFFKDLHKSSSGLVVSTTQEMERSAAEYIDSKVWRDLSEKLVNAWFEKYADQVLEELAPNRLKETVEESVKRKIAEKVLND